MKAMRIATFLALALSLSACSGIYETNTFAALEVAATETDISGMLRESRLDELTATLHESATYNSLSGAELADVEAFVSGLTTNTEDPRVLGAAAESLSALTVHTTSAGPAVQALSDGLELLVASESEETDPTSLLDALIPGEVTETETAFDGFVSTLYELQTTYETLNTALKDPRFELTSPGDVFQGAFVTYLLTSTLDAIDPNGDGVADESRRAKTEVLYIGLTGGEGSLALLQSALSHFSVDGLLADAADADSGIDEILTSSGFASIVAGFVPDSPATSDGG